MRGGRAAKVVPGETRARISPCRYNGRIGLKLAVLGPHTFYSCLESAKSARGGLFSNVFSQTSSSLTDSSH